MALRAGMLAWKSLPGDFYAVAQRKGLSRQIEIANEETRKITSFEPLDGQPRLKRVNKCRCLASKCGSQICNCITS
jgi:hypothetical protein